MFVSSYFSLSKVPAFLSVTDIAGLVKGASEGQGLGNAFLSHIRACDALFHLCRELQRIHDHVPFSWRFKLWPEIRTNYCQSFL